MNNKYEKYLPIGSVVLLKNGQKKVMITGFVQIDMEKIDKIYDYCGCLYPEGVISTQKTLLFNHEDIAQIYCIGLQDEEERSFNQKLKDSMTEDNIKIMIEKAKELANQGQ